jgi:hypothetical protein
LKINGWTKIENNFNSNFDTIKLHAIKKAEEIFDNNFNFKKNQKNYLKSVDFSLSGPSAKIFHDFFTNSNLIDIISNYLNEKPLLTELKLLYSPPTSDEIYSGSQLLHSDFDDNKVVKVFVFINDVDLDSGPLELINKYYSNKIIKLSKYRWGQMNRKYKSHDDNLLDLIVKSDSDKILTSIVGSSGTIVLADTVSCLHRGSRNPIKARKILYATFSTRTSFRFPPVNWIINNKNTILKSSPLYSETNNWNNEYILNK